MTAPRLNTRVRLQARDLSARGPTGQPLESWADRGNPWAEVKGVSGRTFVAASGEQAEVTMQVFIRYRADVTAGWVAVHRGRRLEVVAALPDDRFQFLQLMCRTAAGPPRVSS